MALVLYQVALVFDQVTLVFDQVALVLVVMIGLLFGEVHEADDQQSEKHVDFSPSVSLPLHISSRYMPSILKFFVQ